MGMFEPLTSLALGRSPYEPLDEDEIDDTERLPHEQQYGPNGRPVNPTTRRLNRDIVRAHNEVMLVIGVAEAENPAAAPETVSARRHEEYEQAVGNRLMRSAQHCIDAVGIFGVHGLRQRILTYRQYSHVQFWQTLQYARSKSSLKQGLFAGAPASLITSYTDAFVADLWKLDGKWDLARRCIYPVWSYLRLHLELWAAMQRLNLTSSASWLPSPTFFIPFTKDSPVPRPPALDDLSVASLSRWLIGLSVTATPFFVWAMARNLSRDWLRQLANFVLPRLPSTMYGARKPTSASPPATSSNVAEPSTPEDDQGSQQDANVQQTQPSAAEAPHESTNTGTDDTEIVHIETVDTGTANAGTADAGTANTGADNSATANTATGSSVSARRLSILSTPNEDGSACDGEEAEGVSATLISFDVEASESTELPPGRWSAELRPSQAADSKSAANQQPAYHDTILTQLPVLLSTRVFTDAITRILVAPYEATALRMLARQVRLQNGLSIDDIYDISILSGFNWTSTVNFFLAELVHFTLSSEVWAMFTFASQLINLSEREWRELELN